MQKRRRVSEYGPCTSSQVASDKLGKHSLIFPQFQQLVSIIVLFYILHYSTSILNFNLYDTLLKFKNQYKIILASQMIL